MQPSDLALLQQSFARIMPHREQAAALFYQNLFAIDPSAKPLFANSDMQAQGKKLMSALGTVIVRLRNPQGLSADLAALGRRHIEYGVTDAQYASVGQALLETLVQFFGEDFTPQLRNAWSSAYQLVSTAMIEGAHRPMDCTGT